MIQRDLYLKKLISKKGNGLIKTITGIRRCGKSYLLDPIFKNYLIAEGIKEDHIIKIDLDERRNKKFLNPEYLDEYIRQQIKDEDMYYVILDEIQKVDEFESVLNDFLHIPNIDVGIVELREGDSKKQLEVDFICNQLNKKYYIQSALSLPDREKTIQEERPLMNINDNFKKIIVVKDDIKSWITEEGIVIIGLQEFLLNPNSLGL